MKDKTPITLMVCTAGDGSKVPMSMVGKPKKPACFGLCESGKRAKLRRFEDTMFDACEREGEDEIIDDLRISPLQWKILESDKNITHHKMVPRRGQAKAVFSMVQGDFAAYVMAGMKGDLQPELISFRDGWSICLVSASAGYRWHATPFRYRHRKFLAPKLKLNPTSQLLII